MWTVKQKTIDWKVAHKHKMCFPTPACLYCNCTICVKNNVVSMTYVLERHRNTDCCPVLAMDAHGALLWQPALNASLGMLHYLHCAFMWPRWDMTGATGSSWIKQKRLKAQGEGTGVMGRPEETAKHWGCRLQHTCRRSLRGSGEVRQGGRDTKRDRRQWKKETMSLKQ